MPLYSYKCPACGETDDVLKSLALLDREEPCVQCATPMERQLSAPRVLGDYPGYNCPITGDWIEGRAAHRNNLAKHDCRILEPGESAAVRKAASSRSTALEDSIAESAAQFVTELPTRKREQLVSELENGADVSFTRQGV